MSKGQSAPVTRAARLLWALAVGLLIVLGVRFFRSVGHQGETAELIRSMAPVEPSPVIPFTIVLQEVMSAPEGERNGMMLTVALRGDGASVERVDYQMSRSAEVKRLIFLPPEEFIQTDEVRGTYRRSVMSRRHREPRQQCLASADGTVIQPTERVAARESVGGYDTLVIRGDYGALWLAPDFNCAQLRTRFEFEGGWNERRLVSIALGEPAAALFMVGNLQEVTGVQSKN